MKKILLGILLMVPLVSLSQNASLKIVNKQVTVETFDPKFFEVMKKDFNAKRYFYYYDKPNWVYCISFKLKDTTMLRKYLKK